jgi:DNA-3-methyladenine glycosylase
MKVQQTINPGKLSIGKQNIINSKYFFERDVLEVAPNLLGKYLAINTDKIQNRYKILEVEAYRGEEDTACHASKGKTKRNDIMYNNGGHLYVYLVYGMYWMLNIVTGLWGDPQAVLIRGIKGFDGPGKLTRGLCIDKSFYGENLLISNRIWIEDHNESTEYITKKRIGIDYAGEYWKNKPWRFIVNNKKNIS